MDKATNSSLGDQLSALADEMVWTREEIDLARRQSSNAYDLDSRLYPACIKAAKIVVNSVDIGFTDLAPRLKSLLSWLRDPNAVDVKMQGSAGVCLTLGRAQYGPPGIIAPDGYFKLWTTFIYPSLGSPISTTLPQPSDCETDESRVNRNAANWSQACGVAAAKLRRAAEEQKNRETQLEAEKREADVVPTSESGPNSPTSNNLGARHSSDFVSVFWYGETYEFTTNQAACIKVLWDAWDNRTPVLAQETILEAAGISQERLDMVFRDHPAWKTMIVSSKKGKYRLQEPQSPTI